MTTLLNNIIIKLTNEIAIHQRSYAHPVAEDFASYRERVGIERGLSKALELIDEAYKEWVKNDDDELG